MREFAIHQPNRNLSDEIHRTVYLLREKDKKGEGGKERNETIVAVFHVLITIARETHVISIYLSSDIYVCGFLRYLPYYYAYRIKEKMRCFASLIAVLKLDMFNLNQR